MLRRSWTGLVLGVLLLSVASYGAAVRPEHYRETSAAGQAGSKVAYVYQGDLWLHDLSAAPPRRLTSDGKSAHPAWSPSGRWILFEREYVSWVMDVASGEAHRLSPDSPAMNARWAPQEDRLAFVDDRGRLWTVSADGSGRLPVAGPPGGEPVGAAAWSPNGRWLAFSAPVKATQNPSSSSGGRAAAGLWRVSAADGKPELLYQQTSGERPCVIPTDWTAAGDAVLAWSGTMCTPSIMADGLPLLRVPLGGSPRQLGDTLVHDDFVAPSPRGDLAIVAGSGRMTWTNKRIALFDKQGRGPSFLSPEGVAAISPAWSLDGSVLAYVAQPDLGGTAGEEAIRTGLMQRRLFTVKPEGGTPQQVNGDPRWRDESPHWTSTGQIVFARLDGEGKASLWLTGLKHPSPRQLAVIDSPPMNAFGYYGWIDWSRLFAVWPQPRP